MDAPSKPDTRRRHFIGVCGSAAAIAYGAPTTAWANQPVTAFEPATLTDSDEKPLGPADLQAGTEYVFHYPFKGTPCFLINLGAQANQAELTQANGQSYTWRGGVGPDKSIVAFSAICAHKLSHPSPLVSFIGYRERKVGFLNRETNEIEQRAGVIQCCSEHSIYDPAAGAKVVSGPAPQPLAAIELTVRDNKLVATGVYGGNMFDSYFEKFGNRLMLEHRGDAYKQAVGTTSKVLKGSDYSRNRIQCG